MVMEPKYQLENDVRAMCFFSTKNPRGGLKFQRQLSVDVGMDEGAQFNPPVLLSTHPKLWWLVDWFSKGCIFPQENAKKKQIKEVWNFHSKFDEMGHGCWGIVFLEKKTFQ